MPSTKNRNKNAGAEKENPKQLFVRNLSFNTTNEDLLAAFEEFGPIKNSSVATSSDGKSRGFGFVK
jgi:RNA recognition motif-containing protein